MIMFQTTHPPLTQMRSRYYYYYYYYYFFFFFFLGPISLLHRMHRSLRLAVQP